MTCSRHRCARISSGSLASLVVKISFVTLRVLSGEQTADDQKTKELYRCGGAAGSGGGGGAACSFLSFPNKGSEVAPPLFTRFVLTSTF
jgi:hypothetical protein